MLLKFWLFKRQFPFSYRSISSIFNYNGYKLAINTQKDCILALLWGLSYETFVWYLSILPSFLSVFLLQCTHSLPHNVPPLLPSFLSLLKWASYSPG